MNLENIEVRTPAYIYDVDSIRARLARLRDYTENSPLNILYSIKSASFISLLEVMSGQLDGFATSSLFETRIARQVLNGQGRVHLSTVALLPDQIAELADCCDYININSLAQWQRYADVLRPRTECGLRINPMTNYVDDPRYDPCREHSKLGVPLDHVIAALARDPGLLRGLNGLQFHNNCESRDLQQLVATCRMLLESCRNLIGEIRWVNIGGGYLFDEDSNLQGLADAVSLLGDAGIDRIFFEPGKAIVGDTGYLVSSVVDLFSSNGREIAILDCSVNHLPEVFEFQYRPELHPQLKDGEFEYRLSGITCLSGDLFGDYRFDRPLALGDRVIFRDVGAYMFVKASMFNGINIPPVYLYAKNSGLEMINRQTFEDYQRRLT